MEAFRGLFSLRLGIRNKMSFRSNESAGAIICAVGIVMMVLGLTILSIVGLQRVVFASMPPIPPSPGSAQFLATISVIHRIALLFMPIMIAGGIVFAVTGFHIQRGSLAARRCAQVNAACGYLWGFCFGFTSWEIGSQLGPPPGMSPTLYFPFQIVCGIGNALMLVAIPTLLLCILRRPKIES